MDEQRYTEAEVLRTAAAAMELLGIGVPMTRPVAEFFAAVLRKTDYRRIRVASVVQTTESEEWAVVFYCPEHKIEHVLYNDKHGAAVLEALAREYDQCHATPAKTYGELVRWLGVEPPPGMPLE